MHVLKSSADAEFSLLAHARARYVKDQTVIANDSSSHLSES